MGVFTINSNQAIEKDLDIVFRNAVVRNTSLNNMNVSGETRFKIASIPDANTIVVDQDIPDIVINGIEMFKTDKSQNRKWMLMRDYTSACLINSIDSDKRTIRHGGIKTGSYSVGNNVQFFNPFMNYELYNDAQLLNIQSGTWLDMYACISGIWQTVSGKYRGVVLGLNGKIRMGLAESDDLQTWSILNNGNFKYEPGTGIFNNPISTSTAFVYSNPIKLADNSYLNFINISNGSNGAANNGVGWIKHDDDFNITEFNSTPLNIPNFANSYVQYPGGVALFNNKYYLYVTDRPSNTYNTWRILEVVINPSNMTIESSQVVHTASSTDTYDSKGVDIATPFVHNNKLNLFVFGTGLESYQDSIYSGNRECGFKVRQDNGTFVMDNKSPVILNPINGRYTWNSVLSACGDHTGGITGFWKKDGILYFILSMNASTDTYKSFLLKINLR